RGAGGRRQPGARPGARGRLCRRRLAPQSAAAHGQGGARLDRQRQPQRAPHLRAGRGGLALLAGAQRRAPRRVGAMRGRLAVIGVPYLWLAVFFLLPFAIVLAISLAESSVGIPPYTLLEETPEGGLQWRGQLGNYALLTGDWLYLKAYGNSLLFAGLATLFCLVLGY